MGKSKFSVSFIARFARKMLFFFAFAAQNFDFVLIFSRLSKEKNGLFLCIHCSKF